MLNIILPQCCELHCVSRCPEEVPEGVPGEGCELHFQIEHYHIHYQTEEGFCLCNFLPRSVLHLQRGVLGILAHCPGKGDLPQPARPV